MSIVLLSIIMSTFLPSNLHVGDNVNGRVWTHHNYVHQHLFFPMSIIHHVHFYFPCKITHCPSPCLPPSHQIYVQVTMSTVGYGDIYCMTTLGRAFQVRERWKKFFDALSRFTFTYTEIFIPLTFNMLFTHSLSRFSFSLSLSKFSFHFHFPSVPFTFTFQVLFSLPLSKFSSSLKLLLSKFSFHFHFPGALPHRWPGSLCLCHP